MAGRVLLVLVVLLLLPQAGVQAKIVFEGELQDTYIHLVSTPKGKKVKDVPSSKGVLKKTNGTFFHISKGVYRPIGVIVSLGRILPSTPGPEGQAWLYQEAGGVVTIGEDPPKDLKRCVIAIQGAPLLVKNGKSVVSTKGLRYRPSVFLGRDCLRNIVAIAYKDPRKAEKNKVNQPDPKDLVLRLYQSKGDLKTIAKCLVSQGVLDAFNLDGGESMEDRPVGNSCLICSKDRDCYKQFKQKCAQSQPKQACPATLFPQTTNPALDAALRR